jgi:uncharacterized protein YbjQ (UPF0145 family)
MKIRSACGVAALFAFAMLAAAPASAKDDVYMLQISDAMASPDMDGKLDKSIRYYFGDAPHPAVSRTYGEYMTNQKTNAFNKSDQEACQWVFQSAMLELQNRARRLGANAVINIKSYYKKDIYSSTSQIECHNGFLIAGIALTGTFVALR